jgi:outer membrane protein assembly factor BamB
MKRPMTVRLALYVLAAALVPAAAPAAPAADAAGLEWNQWRGKNRDGISPDTGLLKEWPAGGPKLAWKATGLGGGYAGFSFAGDRLFTLGDQADACMVMALEVATGKPLWSTKVGKPLGGFGKPEWDGPRCAPATDGTLVWALGQFGDLVCVEAATGKEVWRKSLTADFGGPLQQWGFAGCPILDGDLVLVVPGGKKGLVLALNKATGATVWQSQEITDSAHYSSPVVAEIGGVRQVVVLTETSVAGIAVAGGKLLWKAARPGKVAVVPTPIVRDGLVFVSSGYGVGCNAFKVTAADGKFQAEEAYAGKQMVNHHGGLVLVGDHLYGADENSLKCIEFKTGKEVWKDKCVGKGSIVFADGNLVVRSERGAGTIVLVEASPAGYKEKGRFDQPDRSNRNSWPHPVVFGGKLYIRDMDVLLCYDVKAK